ncbi:hypothetical protein MHYP_G00326460 [Metynnis hypsauchen]
MSTAAHLGCQQQVQPLKLLRVTEQTVKTPVCPAEKATDPREKEKTSIPYRAHEEADEEITGRPGCERDHSYCASLNILLRVLRNRERIELRDLDSCCFPHKDTCVQHMRSANRSTIQQAAGLGFLTKEFQLQMSQAGRSRRAHASLT